MNTDSSSALPVPLLRLRPSDPKQSELVVPNDELFIRRAFEEDAQQGCALLFREYYGPLCSHAIRFVHAREVARDIVGDTFCVFWQQKRYQHITTSYRAYLYAAVRNRCLNYLHQELSNSPLSAFANGNGTDEMIQDLPDDSLTPEDLMEYEELHIRVETAIGQLPPQRQKVFMMNRFEGKKYQTIADELQISRKAVEGHISKALVSLRKAFLGD